MNVVVLHKIRHEPNSIRVRGQVVFGLRNMEVMRTGVVVPFGIPGIDGSGRGFSFGEEHVDCVLWYLDYVCRSIASSTYRHVGGGIISPILAEGLPTDWGILGLHGSNP